MLIVYKLLIDVNRDDAETALLPDDLSIGFQNGVYHLSTAPLTGFYDCLDGNSFSEISQENMIVKGGELSQMGDVKIRLMSGKIIRHIMEKDINLLGCKASMFAEIDGNEKSLFENMLVSNYFQKDEVSLEICLKDSTFANAGQINLKIPQGFGASKQLETSYGEECLLKPYRIDKPEDLLSQGMGDSRLAIGQIRGSPELEQVLPYDEILPTRNGSPSFVRNFIASVVRKGDLTTPAKITVRANSIHFPPGPQFFGMEGKSIEIIAGPGKGKIYEITEVEYLDEGFILTLDRTIESGEIIGEMAFAFGSLDTFSVLIYHYSEVLNPWAYWAPDALTKLNVADYSITSRAKYTFDQELLETSIFRLTGDKYLYAIPLARNIIPIPYSQSLPNAQISNDDGSFSDISIKFKEIEKTQNYSIVKFTDLIEGELSAIKTGKNYPRWRVNGNKTTYWLHHSDYTIKKPEFPYEIKVKEGEQVQADSLESDKTAYVATCHAPKDSAVSMQISLYWRVDDLSFDGKYKIIPRFSYYVLSPCYISARVLAVDESGRVIAEKIYDPKSDYPTDFSHALEYPHPAYCGVSLTRNKVIGTHGNSYTGSLLKKLRNLFEFNLDNEIKYIYLQMGFYFKPPSSGYKSELSFLALPFQYVQKTDFEKIYIKGKYDKPDAEFSNIADLSSQLCLDYSMAVDKQSFAETRDQIQSGVYSQGNSGIPFVPFKHGNKFTDKLAEICRAANISMFTDGSKLYAKYFFAGKPEWAVKPEDVIKGSLEFRGLDLSSVSTEWNFSANVQNTQKTLSIETPALSDSFPDESDELEQGFSGTLFGKGYMYCENQGFGAHIDSRNVQNLHIGDRFSVDIDIGSYGRWIINCKLVGVRIDSETEASILFIITDNFNYSDSMFDYGNPAAIITPLDKESRWREIISGTLDINFSDAKMLWSMSQDAFRKTKYKARLDERYSKHQIAAFATDEHWLQNFIKIVKHNSFAKTAISFKVPIDRLPQESLSGLLLKRITLEFGRFKNNTLDGWIVGYSLAPAEDAVRIEFINSEPVRDILWLNENIYIDQLTVDETNPSQDYYKEG
jgi:hypothetical protein